MCQSLLAFLIPIFTSDYSVGVFEFLGARLDQFAISARSSFLISSVLLISGLFLHPLVQVVKELGVWTLVGVVKVGWVRWIRSRE